MILSQAVKIHPTDKIRDGMIAAAFERERQVGAFEVLGRIRRLTLSQLIFDERLFRLGPEIK